MKLSFRWKITLILLVLVLGSLGLVTALHVHDQVEQRVQRMESQAIAMSQGIALNFADPLLLDRDPEDTLQLSTDFWLQELPQVRFITIYNNRGKPIYTSQDDTQKAVKDLQADTSLISSLIWSNRDRIGREHPERAMYELLVPISLKQTDLGVIQLGFDLTEVYQDRRTILTWYFLLSVTVLILTATLGYFLTDRVVRPLEHLSETARELGQGNLRARASVKSGDEAEELANQFNSMAQSLEDHIRDLKTIQTINQKISAHLRQEDLSNHIVQTMQESWELDYVALLLRDERGQPLVVQAGIRLDPTQEGQPLGGFLEDLLLQDEPPGEPIRLSRKQIENIVPILRDVGDEPPNLALFPLRGRDEPSGYLILGRDVDPFNDGEMDLVETISHQVSIAVENSQHYQRAVTDGLTGLYSRRFFDIELEREIESKDDKPISLIMMDIDNFKQYNDTYGHPAGDEVLEGLAEEFQRQMRTADTMEGQRQPDTLARYGGEEFAFILPGTDLEDAVSVAERLLDAIESIDEFERTITLSAGVAEHKHGETGKELLIRADERLYRAKQRGRNQVCHTDE